MNPLTRDKIEEIRAYAEAETTLADRGWNGGDSHFDLDDRVFTKSGFTDRPKTLDEALQAQLEADVRTLLSELDRLTAEVASAKNENDKLRLEFVAKSELIEDLKGELAFYKFEDLAQRFYEENGKGMMAPGKSDPRDYHTFEERSEAWQKWLEERGDVNPLESVLATAREEGRRKGIESAAVKAWAVIGWGRGCLHECVPTAIRSLLTDIPGVK